MKRNSQISLLFEKHGAKKIASSSTPLVIDDEEIEDGGLLLACLDSTPPVRSDIESDLKLEIQHHIHLHPNNQMQGHMMLTFFHMIQRGGGGGEGEDSYFKL
jgi:hypothetical protein